MRKRKGEPIHGWVVLDKAEGLNSTRAVSIIKRWFNAQKAGHAGTLDPLATGVLPIALGEATKTVPYVMDGEKIYRFEVKWGAETTTDDLEGEVISESSKRPSKNEIEKQLPLFTGEIEQIPPQFSALKVDGERAYDLARRGEDALLKARCVKIYDLQITHILPENEGAEFIVRCGKGTYVRALARDMGRNLGCNGHISCLRREKSGPFRIEDTISLEKIDQLRHSALAWRQDSQILKPVETALDDIPALAINPDQAAEIKRGQSVLLKGRDAPMIEGSFYVTCNEELVALCKMEQGRVAPNRVFNL